MVVVLCRYLLTQHFTYSQQNVYFLNVRIIYLILSQNTIMNLLSYLKELNRIEYRTLDDLFDFDGDMPFKEYVIIEKIVS